MEKRHSKIQKRIFLHVAIVIIVTIVVSISAMASVILNNYVQSEVDNSLDKTLKTKQSIEYIFRNANELMYNLSLDPSTLRMLSDWHAGGADKGGMDAFTDGLAFLENKVQLYNKIRIVAFDSDMSQWVSMNSAPEPAEAELLRRMNRTGRRILEEGYFIDASTRNYCLFRIVKDENGKVIGAVAAELSGNRIGEVFASSSYEYQNEKIAIVDEAGTVILAFPNNADFENILSENEDLIRYNTQIINQKVFGKRSILVSNSINYTNWQIIRIINMDAIYQMIYSSIGIALLLLVLLIIAALVSSYKVSHSITEPIIKLRQSVIEFEEANYTGAIPSETDDEIGELAHTFNDIGQRLQESIDKIRENEQRKSEIQMQVLQAQINPHFLYNTLDSIRWMAIINKQNKISDMVIAIIKLLRYNISNLELFVPLEEEIECVRNYISIQSYRYGKTVEMVYAIDGVKDMKVLKFILQPLVENALYHGTNGFEQDIRIQIIGLIEKGNLVLKVVDDGVGIRKKENSEMTSKMHTGIGVNNIRQRIKLYFGEEYDVVMTALEKGVEVKLTMPIMQE